LPDERRGWEERISGEDKWRGGVRGGVERRSGEVDRS
jgi:hypothetical protein